MADDSNDTLNAVELATELTIAWLGNSNTRVNADDVPAFLHKMHETVSGFSSGTSASSTEEASAEKAYEPATTARKSLSSPDHIISMIDGKKYRTLRRHLSTNGLTPDEYRARYGLKPDYPMVAPSYSEARRTMAKSIGLGRKGKGATAEAPAPAKRGRKSAGEAKAAAQAHLGSGNEGNSDS